MQYAGQSDDSITQPGDGALVRLLFAELIYSAFLSAKTAELAVRFVQSDDGSWLAVMGQYLPLPPRYFASLPDHVAPSILSPGMSANLRCFYDQLAAMKEATLAVSARPEAMPQGITVLERVAKGWCHVARQGSAIVDLVAEQMPEAARSPLGDQHRELMATVAALPYGDAS
jgi:hypothetical protein